MSEPFQVETDELRRCAGRSHVVADELDATVAVADGVRPGPESYGRLCVIVPVLLGQLQRPIVTALDTASRSVRGTAHALAATADDYESADENAAALLRDVGGR